MYVLLSILDFLADDFPVITTGGSDPQPAASSLLVLIDAVSFMLAAFFFVWFLGILYGVLRNAEERSALSSVALAGGTVYIILSASGVAVENLVPAAMSRFPRFEQDPQLLFISLTLAGRLYLFSNVGMAILTSSASLLALRRGFLPLWLAWGGLVLALLLLLQFLLPFPAIWLFLVWVAVVSALMIVGFNATPGSERPRPRRTVN
ncbi:MAG: hypothetical protein ACFB50_10275 [Rubrobacteraceae bacterium]